MKFKTLNILVYLCLMINLGLENEQDSSAKLDAQVDQQPLKPLPFYFDFASRGFDVTTQSLFGDLSPGNLKGRIFKLDDIDGTSRMKLRRELRTRSELPRFSKDYNLTLANQHRLDFYNNVNQLNLLLDPSKAAFSPGNYSDQLQYLSLHPICMFESLVFVQNSYLEVTADLSEEFLKKLKELPTKYNKEIYENFVKLYGTHYFRRAEFGGVFRIRGTKIVSSADDYQNENFNTITIDIVQTLIDCVLKKFSGQTCKTPKFKYAQFYNFDNLRTYGGKKLEIDELADPHDLYKCEWLYKEKFLTLSEWIISLRDNSIPIGGEIEPIYNLAEFEKMDEEIVKNLKIATQISIKKFKIKSYIEGINLSLKNPQSYFGKNLTNFSLEEFNVYFNEKLQEDDPIFDKKFLDKCQQIDLHVDEYSKSNKIVSLYDQFYCYFI